MDYLKQVFAYCENHTSLPLPDLYELERETHLHALSPQMLSGRLVGQLLSMLTNLAKPKTALEIGTFTGYSALCIASALPEGGILHTIEVNPELAYMSRKYFQKTGLEHKIRQHLGDAREIIPAIDDTFGLVFIDAAKTEYTMYYDLVFEKVSPGGLILADNVLWDGKVIAGASDAETQAIAAFNRKVSTDERVETLMLPVRDGVMVARKVP